MVYYFKLGERNIIVMGSKTKKDMTVDSNKKNIVVLVEKFIDFYRIHGQSL